METKKGGTGGCKDGRSRESKQGGRRESRRNDCKEQLMRAVPLCENSIHKAVTHTVPRVHQEAPLHEEQHPHEPVCLLHLESRVHPG